MKCLSRLQIIKLHEICISETGGSKGFRDDALLDSALAAPFQSFGGVGLYSTIEQKAVGLVMVL